MIISKISISSLHGEYDYTVDFNSQITFCMALMVVEKLQY